MKSKYMLNEDYSDIEDSGVPISDIAILKKENQKLLAQTETIKADGVHVKEERYNIQAYNGGIIELRVFSPVINNEIELPCLLNFHGGGWVGEGMPHHIHYSLTYAEKLRCKVIFVNYRVALENPFPVPVEDCYCSLVWVVENAKMLRVDPKRIVVYGDSAGGNLAAAVCQMARDRKMAMPCFQMLIYPVTDLSQSTASVKKFTDTPVLNAYGLKLAWELYLKKGDYGCPQYAAPLLADRFSDLPPAYIEVAQFDCLHDDGVEYAKKLQDADIKVELNETLGTFHGFDIYMDRNYSRNIVEHRINVLKHILYKE